MFPHNKAFANAVSAHSTTQQHLQHEEQAALLMAVLGEVVVNNINPWVQHTIKQQRIVQRVSKGS